VQYSGRAAFFLRRKEGVANELRGFKKILDLNPNLILLKMGTDGKEDPGEGFWIRTESFFLRITPTTLQRETVLGVDDYQRK